MDPFCSVSIPGSEEKKYVSRPKILGISRAVFRTCNLGDTGRFFTDFLGYERLATDSGDAKSPTAVTVRINERQSVGLVCASPDDLCGLDSFMVETDDAAALRGYLEAKGYAVLHAGDRSGSFRPDFRVVAPGGMVCGFVQCGERQCRTPDFGGASSDRRISPKMSHVGFMTPDPEAALDFFVGVLGFREVWRGGPDPEKVSWIHLRLPEGEETVELMLFEKRPDRAGAGRMNHICLEVSDMDAARETLLARNLPDGCPQPTSVSVGINRKRQINYYDIDGSRVEIMEDHTIDGSIAPSSTGLLMRFREMER